MSRALIVFLAATLPTAVSAQQAELSVLSEHRVRGLGWSGGAVAPQAWGEVPVGGGFSLSAQATAARGSSRHGGADAAIELSAAHSGDAGLLRWHAGVSGQIFPGGSGRQDFVEIDGGIGGMIGPLDLGLAASYAPSQAAIGGSNLHLGATARLALVGTPVTLSAAVGRSSGSSDDPEQAARLRPGGAYTDWSLGGRYVVRRLSVSLTYTDTDISGSDVPPAIRAGGYGASVVAGVHLAL